MPAAVPGFSSYSSFFSLFTPLKANNNAQHQFATPALDHVEMEEAWFDALEYPDEVIPLTEDARRCLRQLISAFGEIKQTELIFSTLLKCFPALPAEIINAAYSLYTATLEGRNIDFAVLNTLGLTSSYWLADGNIIARLAQYILDTVSDTLGEYIPGVFGAESNNASSGYLFTALAALAITAKYYWRNDNNSPQRAIFRLPAFLGHLLLRASVYWNQLEHIARHAAQNCAIQIPGEADIHCVMQQNRSQVSERVANQQSWLCTQGDDPHYSGRKAAAKCDFTYTPSELRKLREQGILRASRALPAENPETVTAADTAAASSSGAEMTALIVPAAIATQALAPNAGLGRGLKIAGALGTAAVVITAGGLLIRYLSSARETATPAPGHTGRFAPQALALNESDIIHLTPPPFPPPLPAAHVDDSWIPPELKQRAEDEPRFSLDDVKIKKMFYVECLKELEWHWPSVAAFFRTVGNLLESPRVFIRRKLAIAVAFYYDEGQKGCPSEMVLEEISQLSSKFDNYVDFIAGMLPYSAPFIVAQTIVGPSLTLMADYLEGKNLNPLEKYMVFAQLIFIVAQAIPTMSHSEIAAIYEKKTGRILTNDLLSKRFIPEDGTVKVRVNGKKYQYHTLNNRMSCAKIDGELRLIRYNHDKKRWETVNEMDYLRAHPTREKYKQRYGSPLNEIVSIDKTPSVKSDVPGKLPILTREATTQADFVMVDHTAVHVEIYILRGKVVTVASSVDLEDKAVLRHTAYGWEFEPAGVEMDESLQLLLESGEGGEAYTHQNRFTEISPDGFSYSFRGELFVKHENRYHKAEKIAGEEAWRLTGYSGARIIRSGGRFRLAEADDMLFSTDLKQVGVSRLEPHGSPVFVEGAAQTLLLKEGVRLDAATAHSRVAPGVYQGTEKTLFTVKDGGRAVNFQVTHYNDREVSVTRADDKGTIDLWREGNIWIRVRKPTDPVPDSYRDTLMSTCRSRRQAPAGGKECGSVVIEKSLEQMLEGLCSRGGSAGKVANAGFELASYIWSDIVLYVDKSTVGQSERKFYFRYDNQYDDQFTSHLIEAEPIDGTDENGGVSCLKLFATPRAWLSRRRPQIAEVVIEKKVGKAGIRSELKTREMALAEHTGVNINVAKQFLAKTESFQRIRDVDILTTVVVETGKRRDMYVAPLPNISSSPHTPGYNLDRLLGARLYPERLYIDPEYSFSVYDLKGGDKLPVAVKDTQEQVRLHIEFIRKFALLWAMRANGHVAREAEHYLTTVLKTPIHSHSAVFKAVDERLDRLDTYLVPGNIKLVKALKYGWSDYSVLTEEEVYSGDVILLNPADNKLYINVDKIHLFPSVNIVSGILSGSLRANGMTIDIMKYKYSAGVLHAPIMDVIEDMASTIRSGNMPQRDDFLLLSKDYLRGAMQTMNAPTLSFEAMAWLLKHHPGYRTHMVLNSTPTMEAIIEDLYDMTLNGAPAAQAPFNVPGDPSIKKGIQTLRTGVKPERVFTNNFSIDEFDTSKSLRDLLDIPEVAAAVREPKEKCEMVAPFVAQGMKQQGFTDIRYRAMAFFLHPGDTMPNTHFAVIGHIEDVDYVVDVTAGQFHSRYEEFSEPIIMPVAVWEQKYANIISKCLIIYGDYPSMVAANTFFGPASKYLSWGPEYKVPDTFVLRRPHWYYPEIGQVRHPRRIVKRGLAPDIDVQPDDVLIKRYNPASGGTNTTILQSAMNDAMAMNRIYGDCSAAVLLPVGQNDSPAESNSTTVASSFSPSNDVVVKMIKLPGVSVSSILRIVDETQSKIYRNALTLFLYEYNNPAEMIAKKLQSAGVYHPEINEDNVFFDTEFGFSPVNFETSEITIDGETVSAEKTAKMTARLNSVINKMRNKFPMLPPVTSTVAPAEKDFYEVSSYIDEIENALTSAWCNNDEIVKKVETLQSVTEEKLNAGTISPMQARRLSARINKQTQSVNNVVNGLETKKKENSAEPFSFKAEANQLNLNSIQMEINIAHSVRNILYALGVKLNRVFLEQGNKPRSNVKEISSSIDVVEKALTLAWYRNESVLKKVKILQAETEYALNSGTITPGDARSLSDRIEKMRKKSVDNNVRTLKAQKKRYEENPLPGDAENQQRRINNVQHDVDIATSVNKTLNDLRENLNKLSLKTTS